MRRDADDLRAAFTQERQALHDKVPRPDYVLYREAFAAIIREIIPYGSQVEVARALAIPDTKLSGLKDRHGVGFAQPEFLEQLVAEVGASNATLQQLLDLRAKALSGGRPRPRAGDLPRLREVPRGQIEELRVAFGAAVFSSSSNQAHSRQQIARDLGETIISQVDRRSDPLNYAEALSSLAHLNFMSGESAQGLAHAISGWRILDELGRQSDPYVKQYRFHDLMMQIVRDIGLAYHNLGDEHRALSWFDEGRRLLDRPLVPMGVRERALRDFLRNSLIVMSGLPRVPLRQARVMADQCIEFFANSGDELNVLLTEEHMARVCISQYRTRQTKRSLFRARESLERSFALLDRSADAGLDHQAALLRTQVDLFDVMGDVEEWRQHLDRALRHAQAAGLRRRYVQLLRLYDQRDEVRILAWMSNWGAE